MSETIASFERRLRELGAGELAQALHRFTMRVALKAEARAKMNATTRLRVRSGRLRNSIAGTVEPRPGGVAAVLSAGGRVGGAPVRYAAIHEYGGTITPKRGRFLVFSLDGRGRTPAGVPRISTPGGALVFARSVTLPARRYLRDALRDTAADVPGDLQQVIAREVSLG